MVTTQTKPARVEFDELFRLLTGIHPDSAQIGDDGFLFIPPSAMKMDDDETCPLRGRISDLSGPNGWRNHLVDDNYAGWWIRRPTA